MEKFESHEKFKSLVLATFKTESGKKLLDLLVQYYLIDNAVAPHHQTSSYGYYREGENNVVRMFNNVIKG